MTADWTPPRLAPDTAQKAPEAVDQNAGEIKRRTAWASHYPEGSPAASLPAPPLQLAVPTLILAWAALGNGLSGLGAVVGWLRTVDEWGLMGGQDVEVFGHPLGGPLWALVVVPLSVATVVVALRFMGGRPVRTTLWPVLGWAAVSVFLQEPWETRLVVGLVLLVIAGALLHGAREADGVERRRALQPGL